MIKTLESNDFSRMLHLRNSIGFDQFGSAHGEMNIFESCVDAYAEGKIPKAALFEFNLPGLRQRRWHEAGDVFVNCFSIVGCGRDGCIFNVECLESDDGLKRYDGASRHLRNFIDFNFCRAHYGNVRTPNGNVLPIEKMDVASNDFFESLSREVLFKTSKLMFKASFQCLTSADNIKGKVSKPLTISFQMKLNEVEGTGVMVVRSLKQPNDSKLIAEKSFKRSNQTILSFDNVDSQMIEICGGKGSSLAKMTFEHAKSDKYFTPRGFIITVNAFEQHVKKSTSFLENFERVAQEKSSIDLKAECER